MARRKSMYDSKTAESCPCSCCKWHSSKTIKGILIAMFFLMIVGLAASVVFSNVSYFRDSVFAFVGVTLLIVFIGWVFSFFCECKGLHWSRHNYVRADDAKIILKRRYAKGEITKKDFDKIMKDLE